MLKWIVLLVATVSMNLCWADLQDLPLPLPDDPGHQQPVPRPPQPPPSGDPIRYSLGTGDLTRFKEREFTFYPRMDLNKVMQLSLLGSGNKVVIKEVRIQYADTLEEKQDYILPGDLQAGGTRTVRLDLRPIYRITVKASSAYFWKKPGNFRVDVAAYR